MCFSVIGVPFTFSPRGYTYFIYPRLSQKQGDAVFLPQGQHICSDLLLYISPLITLRLSLTYCVFVCVHTCVCDLIQPKLSYIYIHYFSMCTFPLSFCLLPIRVCDGRILTNRRKINRIEHKSDTSEFFCWLLVQ